MVLQWGRVRLNAETTRGRVRFYDENGASMGPRSVERGNWSTGMYSKGRRATLQWGRVRLNAETNPCYNWGNGGDSFNGAAFG